jgi:hypothetical protein
MSPRTIGSLLIVLAAVWYGWSGFQQAESHKRDPLPKKAFAASPSPPTFIPGLPDPAKRSWPRLNIGRATIECPVGLNPVALQRTEAQRRVADLEQYTGMAPAYGVSFTHAFFPLLRGELMLDTFSRALNSVLPQYDFTRYPSTSGAVMVNGLRARRFDLDRVERSTRMHNRLVVFTKGNQAWVIEVISKEDSADGEQIFQRIAYSLKPD